MRRHNIKGLEIRLIGISVHLEDYKLPCDKMALHSRPFESVDFFLKPTHFWELLHLFKTNKGICTKIVGHITIGMPSAARFAVSTDVRCKSPEYGALAVLIVAVLYD